MNASSQSLLDMLRAKIHEHPPAERMRALEVHRAAIRATWDDLQRELATLDDAAGLAAARAALSGKVDAVEPDRRPALRDALAANDALSKVADILAAELEPIEHRRLQDEARAALEAIIQSAHERQRALIPRLAELVRISGSPPEQIEQRTLVVLFAVESFEIDRLAFFALPYDLRCKLDVPRLHRGRLADDVVPSQGQWFNHRYALPEREVRALIRAAVEVPGPARIIDRPQPDAMPRGKWAAR